MEAACGPLSSFGRPFASVRSSFGIAEPSHHLPRGTATGVWASPYYVIPNCRPASERRSEPSDKVISDPIKRVASRAGHISVHALRAAFAAQFEDAQPPI